MGGFFGGKPKTQSTAPVRLNGIQINQSSYGTCVPLCYGTGRIKFTLVDYDDFTAIKQSQAQPGKGGGGGNSGQASYNYTSTLIGLLCEGPIKSIHGAFDGSTASTLAALNLQVFLGGNPQPVWQYMAQRHPDKAIPYDGWAYVAGAPFQLGSSAGIPNLTFETTALLPYVASLDAEPSAVIQDYCTDPNHGCGFPYLASDMSAYRNYCLAMQFLISPQEQTQRSAVAFLQEVLQTTNSNAVFTAGVGLRFVPYADQAVSSGMGAFTPDLTPVYAFKDIDYVRTGDDAAPVQQKDVPPNETWNVWNVEFLDRQNQYNTGIGPFKDSNDIAVNGMRVADTTSLHMITSASMAVTVAAILCARNLYIRRTFIFPVRLDFCLLEPMDLVAINDPKANIVNQLVRVTNVSISGDGSDEILTITAEEMFAGPASPPQYDTELAQGFVANYGADPGPVATPYIFTAPPALVGPNGGYELWIAVCGTTGNWGWADVYSSLDNVTYEHEGKVVNPARVGSLVNAIGAGADPDTSTNLTVKFDDPQAVTVGSTTQAGADNLRTLAILGGEILSWQTATPLGNNQYVLRYLRRGLYNSNRIPHAQGERFAIIDNTLLRMPFDPGYSGLPVWFKFVSTNFYGGGEQDISKVPAYQVFFQGQNNGALLPAGATPLIASGNCSIVGNKITKWLSASPIWGDAGAYSVDAFSGGCTVKFQPCMLNAAFMIGLNSDPRTDNSYVSIDHAWFCSNDGNSYIFESGLYKGQFGPPYSLSDVFEIRYDGKFVTYYINGVKYLSIASPAQTLYLDSSFFTPGCAAQNVYFGSLNPANASPFVPRGNCVVSDEYFSKGPGGSTAWDSDIYSLEGFQTCHVAFKASQTNLDFIIGLSAFPAQGTDPGSITFGLYCTAAGTLWAVNSSYTPTHGGYPLPGTPTYTTSDLLAVTCDGVTIRVFQNNTSIYSITLAELGVSSGAAMFLDSAWLQPGAAANSVLWGPTTQVALSDTAQISLNAATDVYTATLAGPYGFSASPITPAVVVQVSFTALANGTATTLCTFNAGWTATNVTSLNTMWLEVVSPLLGSRIVYIGTVPASPTVHTYALQLVSNMTLGDTITAKLWYQPANSVSLPNDHMSVTSVSLRVEAIKR